MMTNGTVGVQVSGNDGHVLTVKYKDGEKKIVITPESTIRAYVVGDKSELKPGASIATFAVKKTDGPNVEIIKTSSGATVRRVKVSA